VSDVEEFRRARLDIREDEAAVHGAALGGRDGLHVPAELELEALEARGSRQLPEVLGEMQGLDLVHHDAPVLLEAAVEAALEHGREIAHGVGQADGLLDRVAGNLFQMLAQHATVHRLSDPEPLESLAPVEAGPPRDAAEERAGGKRNCLRFEIDCERHSRL